MRITTTISAGTFEAKLADRMNFSDHKIFRALIHDVTASGAKSCVLEIGDLTAIDSSGLGMFVIAIEASKAGGWMLTLKGAQGQVKHLLLMAKFDKLVAMID